jgi:ankyrin repeat protein
MLFIQSRSHMKYTALGIAAYKGNTGIVTMLVKAGADVNYQHKMVGCLSFLLSAHSRAPAFPGWVALQLVQLF